MSKHLERLKEFQRVKPMPDFKPNYPHIPGVKPQEIPAEERAVADAFSVIQQQNQWQAQEIVRLSDAVTTLMLVVLEEVEARKDLTRTPIKILGNALGWVLKAAGTAFLAIEIAKWAGVPVHLL